MEDAKRQKYSVFCLGPVNSCTNKHEAAQLAGLHSQRWNNPEVQAKLPVLINHFPSFPRKAELLPAGTGPVRGCLIGNVQNLILRVLAALS